MEIDRKEWAKMVGSQSPLETLRTIVDESLAHPSRQRDAAHVALMLLAKERHRLRVERQMLLQRMARIGNAFERALRGLPDLHGLSRVVERYAKLANQSVKDPVKAIKRELGKNTYVP